MVDICFISSTGGHLAQLKVLMKDFKNEQIALITEKNETTKFRNQNYKIFYLKQQERSNMFFPIIFLVNVILSFFYLLKLRPRFIISTGAGAVIPFCILGKLLGSKLIYIESFAKISSPTLTGKILYYFADKFYVQWEELLNYYHKKAEFKGRLY
ncbi:PssD/Cps14F family polysaccharide biosynthesis glycosyltransferase [Heyndrickxia coagulans]|uniref:Oligosaccharide biosynthesis protein Alg14 like protein n=1 Tax=Heyndrickxia coagulans 36D1 TaxID=345219 RepID=G2TR19_HEYCO|nr:PssD/Cps14F family polysaccharide biosynthesis glycosyltransferase [Heyndrickxia coagulans]AEP00095.1 Oligosaccharide biosynthesis protein Alg14 like protein [Heyndrickxia coagulans 36D1]